MSDASRVYISVYMRTIQDTASSIVIYVPEPGASNTRSENPYAGGAALLAASGKRCS